MTRRSIKDTHGCPWVWSDSWTLVLLGALPVELVELGEMSLSNAVLNPDPLSQLPALCSMSCAEEIVGSGRRQKY